MPSAAPLAFLGFPSVDDIVRKVVSLLFSALSQALLPDFLRNGTVDAIRWLIAVPNPANAVLWPNVARLEGDMSALAFGLLGLTLVTAATRQTLAGVTGGPHPITALSHTLGAGAMLALYHWGFANTVALVNVSTHQVLEWPVVAQGLGRTVKVLFGGSLLIGAGSVFLAALALVAILFAVTLFVMKVSVLMLAAILYVAGPVVIALYPLPETARFTRLWLTAALVVAFIPLGWCVIFATAGALSLDVTSFGALGHQGTASVIGAKTVGAFAGLLMFGFAAMWPMKLTRHVTSLAGGPAASPGAASTASIGSARVQAAQAKLRAGVMAGGAVMGRAAGAAGAPRGGLAGAGLRAARAAAPRAAAAAAAAAAAVPLARAGAAAANTGPGRAARERVGRAAAAIREGRQEVTAAVVRAGASDNRPAQRSPRPGSSSSREQPLGGPAPAFQSPEPAQQPPDRSRQHAEPRSERGDVPRAQTSVAQPTRAPAPPPPTARSEPDTADREHPARAIARRSQPLAKPRTPPSDPAAPDEAR